MAGYRVDPGALESAIKKLEELRNRAERLVRQAAQVKPGELTANDNYTNQARMAIQERATGEHGSLRVVSQELMKKLEEKINAYNETLREYRDLDEASAVAVNRINAQA
ncbi:hypothetical protein [Saccharopolyspora hordei]|uniref:PE domain-containing protein n=1 Tax=Saccharopolyspora hordei TaxID=1838 RepID=A0A853AGN8_9PSEU|nr:hypothetical protein [Saccharopolyspora hordei]NYI83305.1 hypothetical protein [Saccharopolyspora hordei]